MINLTQPRTAWEESPWGIIHLRTAHGHDWDYSPGLWRHVTHVPETIDLGGRYKPNKPFSHLRRFVSGCLSQQQNETRTVSFPWIILSGVRWLTTRKSTALEIITAISWGPNVARPVTLPPMLPSTRSAFSLRMTKVLQSSLLPVERILRKVSTQPD